MVNEYKKIVLLKGLENISDYHFKAIKSLLTHDLRLTGKMRDQFNRIQIADLMEEKFQHDAGLDKLIEFFEDIPTLKGLAKTLRKEKLKVVKNTKSVLAKGKKPSKKSKQGELGPATLTPTTSKVLKSEGAEETPVAQKRKNTTTEKTGTKKKKVPEEQMQPPCPAGASTSSPMGHAPPAQISSPAPSSTSSTEGYLMNQTLSLTMGRFLSCVVLGEGTRCQVRTVQVEAAVGSLSAAPVPFIPLPFAR
ncbi:PREDICTED: pyrin and HIN domain-containing protein 1 [Galeopterus variegatus]|uniref:Pyrin and HIN domain-containing protein 1 n=1 Tax=Galeopterus variegatus TaxID=482537 RepID=A0ABM0RZZ5_GALVR|nr:PREDICTED: pyrin and HIN domain-containing protein 1 [Galeopterus variegatus]